MHTCPECENLLDIEEDEAVEGDIIPCDECGTEFEIVATEPLQLARVEDEYDEEDDDEFLDEEEEDEE